MPEEDVISFYEKHNLNPLSVIEYSRYISIIFAALPNGKIFTSFVKSSFTKINNKFKINFDSWEELMSCYCLFISEFCKKNNGIN